MKRTITTQDEANSVDQTATHIPKAVERQAPVPTSFAAPKVSPEAAPQPAAKHVWDEATLAAISEETRREKREAIRWAKEVRAVTSGSRTQCLITGMPIEHGSPVRVFLLLWEDSRSYGSEGIRPRGRRLNEYIANWRLVGLPFRARYRCGDNGFFPPEPDIAWSGMKTYFWERFGLRIRRSTFKGQLEDEDTHIKHPIDDGKAWIKLGFALEPAYRWLVARMGKAETRRGNLRRWSQYQWREWRNSPEAKEIDPKLPFGDYGDQISLEEAVFGLPVVERKMNRSYHQLRSAGPIPSLGYKVALGLGPTLHATLRGNAAARSAIVDSYLALRGLDELGLRFNPVLPGVCLSAWKASKPPNDLTAELIKWVQKHDKAPKPKVMRRKTAA